MVRRACPKNQVVKGLWRMLSEVKALHNDSRIKSWGSGWKGSVQPKAGVGPSLEEIKSHASTTAT